MDAPLRSLHKQPPEFAFFTTRSSRPEVFCKKVLRNFAKFTGKHLCHSLFFNKVAGLNFAKFLRTHIFIENL